MVGSLKADIALFGVFVKSTEICYMYILIYKMIKKRDIYSMKLYNNLLISLSTHTQWPFLCL